MNVNNTVAPMAQPAVPSGLAVAQAAASMNLPVFPIVPGKGIPYSADDMNELLGLPPGTPAGVHHATTDRQRIQQMWAGKRAGAWIGIAMGNGRMAIDLDEKNGKSGTGTMRANGWTLPATAMQRTKSGGYHCIVDVPPGRSAPTDSDVLGSGIDRRGDGGYVVLYDPKILTAQRASAPEWSMRCSTSTASMRTKSGSLAPDYAIALEALQSRSPDDLGRDEWLLFSGAFFTATAGLADDDRCLSDWQAWNARHGPTNDAAANARAWSDFRRNGTAGDWHALADRSESANAKGWRWFNGAPIPPRPHSVRPDRMAKDPGNFFMLVGNIVPRDPVFLVDGLIEEDSTNIIFGEPGTGKSLVAIDLSASIATGTAFHGRNVKQGAVFYIAGEGMNGLRRRFAAWETVRGVALNDAPLFQSRSAVQILDSSDAQMLASALDAMAQAHGNPLLIVLDTLARNFGPGDENSTSDMNRFVAAIDQIREMFPGSSVLIVHHSGHGEKQRARGSSVLRAAADSEYMVSRVDDALHLTCCKMKEAEQPPVQAFTLTPACGSVALEYTGVPDERSAKLSANQTLAMQAFNASAVNDSVSIETWRAAFYVLHTGSDAAKRKAFSRSRDSLIETRVLQSHDGNIFFRVPMPGIIVDRSAIHSLAEPSNCSTTHPDWGPILPSGISPS